MSREPRGLGKGLSALLGEATDVNQLRKPIGYVNKEIVGSKTKQDTADVLRIPVDMIEPNPYQPRMNFDKDALEELSESIKTLGIIQPITVRKISESRYQIISGERRFKASRMAGLTMIPAFIRETNDQGMLEMAIVENIQRENLDPIEEALSYQRLMDECNLTQEEMAGRVSKKRASVANQLRLLKLPAKVQHDLKVGLLSVGHAKVLLSVESAELQEQLCDMVIAEGLNVRQLEARVRQLVGAGKQTGKKKDQELPEEYYKVLSNMGRWFSKDISLKRGKNGKGTMTVHFESDDEIRAFLEALEK